MQGYKQSCIGYNPNEVNRMQSNKTCLILEQYLSYLSTIKGRSICTIKEYRTDILLFLWWLAAERKTQPLEQEFSFADIDFLQSITIGEMYAFIVYCQDVRKSSQGTKARKIVSLPVLEMAQKIAFNC
jgi:site-specific recombinase XerD